MLEGLTGYKPCQGLVLLSLAEGLPPVRVLTADYVQHVAFLKAYT